MAEQQMMADAGPPAGDGSMADLLERVAAAGATVLTDDGEPVRDIDGVPDGDSDDEDHVTQDPSEGDPDGGDGGEEDGDPASRLDEDESFSRMRLNLGRQAKQLTEYQTKVRALEQEVKRLSDEARSRGDSEPGDLVDHLQATVMRRLGVKDPRDPRVLRQLEDLATDLTAEFFEGSDAVESMRERREQRRQERAERERHEGYQRQLDEMKAERLRESQQRQAQEVVGMTRQFLTANSARTPFLTAAAEAGALGDVDLAQYVFEAAQEGMRTGQWTDPQTTDELAAIYGRICGNLEAHFRAVAGKLGPLAGKAGGDLVKGKDSGRGNDRARGIPQTRRGGSAKGRDTRTGRFHSTSGGGGRGSAPPETQQSDDDTPDDLGARFERELKRRQTASGRRRN